MKKKQTKQGFLAGLLAALMLFSLVGCTTASNTSQGGNDAPPAAADTGSANGEAKEIKDIVVGVSIGTTTEERWNREIEMFRAYAADKGFELLVQDAGNDTTKQVSQCENLLNQGVDVLIVQPLDGEAVAPIVDAAHQSGIKVISYDRFIMNSDLDYYITFDTYTVGKVQAEMVVEQAPKGNFIWLLGAPEDNNAHIIETAQTDVLQPLIDSGDIKIVTQQWCKGWSPAEALQHTENALTSAANDVQGVVCSNDGTAGGAIQALAAQGLAGSVPIAGQDADIAACQRIVEGTQYGTVYKPLAPLNQAACELAVAIATGADEKNGVDSALGSWTTYNNNFKDVDAFNVAVEAITKENLYDIVIKRDAFHTVEEVYANVPQEQWPTD
ncbi:sugar ABC transporter substrate-binding protein [uncultured Oscillibacter sp.]|uniref:sugar ABC transporter substrate-binding protein n=1 Tax=uncultured Oscillibacter sp. TaxID=876091 RepID=UPI0026349C6B|nr:substrate-binding domain-containing protein [uncultured Oscillibacter sp.]